VEKVDFIRIKVITKTNDPGLSYEHISTIVPDIEGLDLLISRVVSKILYHYEMDNRGVFFVVVPVEYGDRVKEITERTVVRYIGLQFVIDGGRKMNGRVYPSKVYIDQI